MNSRFGLLIASWKSKNLPEYLVRAILEKKGNMNEAPLLSIVLVMRKYYHLSFMTLDSLLAQTEKNFEIIIVEQGASPHDLAMVKNYAREISEVISCGAEMTFSAIMNKAAKSARGRYINFLTPGCSYVSKFNLKHFAVEMEKQGFPDFFYSAFLRREVKAAPSVVHKKLSWDLLKRGKSCAPLYNLWFAKTLFDSLGGFNENYSYRETFDLVCRVYKANVRAGSTSRVLVDFIPERKTAKEHFRYAKETINVIYNHFGLWKTLFWWLSKEGSGFFKVCLRACFSGFHK